MHVLKIEYTAASHICGRRRNEDNYLVNKGVAPVWAYEMCTDRGQWDTSLPRVAAVCDGIGGGDRGDTASLIALKTIEAVLAEYLTLPYEELIFRLAQEAQNAVLNYFDRLGSTGGCTLSMVVLHGDRWVYLNIGDSPAFLWKEGSAELTELSQRHNLEGEKLRMGIPPAPGDECRLMRYLGKRGCTARDMAHWVQGELNPGDGLLLCTDGITNAFSPEQLRSSMSKGASARDLVLTAAAEPNSDNSTAVCIQMPAPERENSSDSFAAQG